MAARKTKKKKKKGKGSLASLELRAVMRNQHRALLDLIDRAETSLSSRAMTKIEQAMTAQLDLEAEILHPKGSSGLALYAHESHAVIRFALARACERDASSDERHARLRVLRDLFVHHAEREEWLTIERMEFELSDRATLDLARRLAIQPVASAAPAATTRKGK